MANIQRGQIEIELCGKKYKLTPSFEAICEIEDMSGKGIPAMFLRARKGNLGIKDIVAIIYGGLVASGKHEFTFADVGNMVRKTGLASLAGPCYQMLIECLYDKDDAAEKKSEDPQ